MIGRERESSVSSVLNADFYFLFFLLQILPQASDIHTRMSDSESTSENLACSASGISVEVQSQAAVSEEVAAGPPTGKYELQVEGALYSIIIILIIKFL